MKRQSHAVQTDRQLLRALLIGLLVFFGSIWAGFIVLIGLVARRVVTPANSRNLDAWIVGIDRPNQAITLRSTPDTILPGRYGLWVGGTEPYLLIGPVISHDGKTVTRGLLSNSAARVHVPGPAAFSGWVYRHPRDLGVPYREVRIPTALGTAPAWFIPAEDEFDEDLADAGTDWAIHVHGRGVQRPECLRGVPVFRSHGFASLVVSYRNDSEASASPDGKYSLGDTEWQDVESAIEYAIGRGARRIVLVGWSMGGAIVLQTITRSRFAAHIVGIVLESPVIEWNSVLHFQAAQARIPGIVRDAAVRAIGNPWGRPLTGQDQSIDMKRLDLVANAESLEHPILILHSDDDGYVPSIGSRALAEARPDIVTFVPFTVARHTKLWNYDEKRWNASIESWLDASKRGSSR